MNSSLRTISFGLLVLAFALHGRNAVVRSGRVGETVTLLPSGGELVLGGEGQNGAPVDSAAVNDLATGKLSVLPAKLSRARAWHTATVLPDGTVLVLGGLDASGQVVGLPELFDPTTGKLSPMQIGAPAPRAYHTATVLTDGTVLIAGGISTTGETLASLELWNPRSGTSNVLNAQLTTARRGHTAQLLPDGRVFFWGGTSATGMALDFGEIYDPATGTIQLQAGPFQTSSPPPFVEASVPEDGAENVPTNAIIGVRFSQPIRVQSVTTQNVTLRGESGIVAARVVPAEGGMLAFITPNESLSADSTYMLDLSGLYDSQGVQLPETTISFTTGEGDLGLPGGATAWDGKDPFASPWRKLPSLQASAGLTALAGQVLKLSGEPLHSVTLQIGDKLTRSDATGRFLLRNVPSGHQVLWIDGGSAGGKGVTYGVFEVGVNLAAGHTTALDYTIWMTALDMAHAVTTPSPTRDETVIKTPEIPGLEVHLPSGAVIRDRNDKVVTKVSITPVPLSQPPFPVPKMFMMYYTIQPGGAYIEGYNSADARAGAHIVYPNMPHLPAHTRIPFYDYDADSKGWFIYGHGSVDPGGSQIVPDPGAMVYEFTGASLIPTPPGPPSGPPSGGGPPAGDPVDLSTGFFVYSHTDMTVPDTVPIKISRTYRQGDPNSYAFGIGNGLNYDIYLVGDPNDLDPSGHYADLDLVLANGSEVHYQLSALIGNLSDPQYEHTYSSTRFFGSQITKDTNWNITLKDGTVYKTPLGQTNPRLASCTSITDRFGNTLTLNRDGNGNLIQIVSPSGKYITLTYDTSNRVTQAQDYLGRTVSYTYDGTGRLSTVTDMDGGVTTYTYDTANELLTIKDPRQIVYLTNEYDSNGRVSKQTMGDGGIYLFAYTLDANNNVTQTDVTDPRGNIHRVSFNTPPAYPNGYITGGYATSETVGLGKPEQQIASNVWNQTGFPGPGVASNLLQSVTDSLGRTTSFTYDSMGNPASVTRQVGTPSAVTWAFTYDPTFSQLTTSTDPLNHTSTLIYNSTGALTGTTDALSHTWSYVPDALGRNTSTTDPLGNQTTFMYDPSGLTDITNPLGDTAHVFHDAYGRVVSATDPLGNLTTYAYDNSGDFTSRTDPQGNATTFAYDPDGDLKTITDAKHNTQTYSYDNMDRVISHTDGLNNQETYQYDLLGNLVSVTDRRGKVTFYTYDALNRLNFVGYGTQPGPTYESTVAYTYDGANRVVSVADSANGTITRNYDGLDRLTSEVSPQGTVSYTYDAANRVATKTVAGQTAIAYTYDAADRLTQMTQGSTVISFGYDVSNRRTFVTLADGIAGTYSYDNNSRITGITYASGRTTLGTLTYTYDALGREIAVGGTFARTNLPASMVSAAYNANNQVTTWGSASVSYDANGNVLSDGTNTYVWNARNQLVSMNSGTMTFQYDGLGRRMGRSLLGTTTNYLYDGVTPVQELQGGSVVANMISGGTDEMLLRTDSAGARSFLADRLGSTVALADSHPTIQTQYTYDPFGNPSTSGSSSNNRYEFTGREFDPSGLYFYRSRYYNPQFDRFISEDPIRFAGGVNLYTYVGDNPVNLTDPLGLAQCLYTVGGHTLTCVSSQNPANQVTIGSDNTHSGASGCKDSKKCQQFPFLGPIPAGKYRMNKDNRPGHESWYRLESIPAIPWWQYYSGVMRSGFALHLGTHSLGCINVDKNNPGAVNEYQQLLQLLDSEQGDNYLFVEPE